MSEFITSIGEYPRVMYHADYDPLTVYYPEEEAGLGESWFRTPWEPKGVDQDGNPVADPVEHARPRRRKAADPADEG